MTAPLDGASGAGPGGAIRVTRKVELAVGRLDLRVQRTVKRVQARADVRDCGHHGERNEAAEEGVFDQVLSPLVTNEHRDHSGHVHHSVSAGLSFSTSRWPPSPWC